MKDNASNNLKTEELSEKLTEKKTLRSSLRPISMKPNNSFGKSHKIAGLKWRRNPVAKWIKK